MKETKSARGRLVLLAARPKRQHRNPFCYDCGCFLLSFRAAYIGMRGESASQMALGRRAAGWGLVRLPLLQYHYRCTSKFRLPYHLQTKYQPAAA